MVKSESYWYDIESSSVVRAEERKSEAWLGPFSTADEAEEAPATFVAHAQAWLNSEEGQHYLELAKDEFGDDLPTT